jgi:SAM-dependent methyltransferase
VLSDLFTRLTRPFREWRWRRSGWSTADDKTFHDTLFTPGAYDPFDPSYPGYLTIRRFADHADARLDGVATILDLGCGPGEITCELARRRPDARFTGIDHSEQAIRAARANAERLSLTNITFDVADVESYVPAARVDLVCMFDAFHHLLAPRAFVERMRPHAGAFLLIEPAGKWTGQWDRRFDLDWVAEAVAGIRTRLEHQFGLEPGATAPRPAAADLHGEPTEHRYTETDLAGFFAGMPIEMHGTIAGLERYGVDPHASSALKAKFGELTYDLVRGLEETLTSEGIDLWAKHWVVFASPANASARVRPSRVPPRSAAPPPSGPWMAHAARYAPGAHPTYVHAGQAFEVECEIANDGWLEWRSDGAHPVMISYRWLDAAGARLPGEGTRTPLPRAVAQGQSIRVNARVTAPATSGACTLALDLVEEGKTWFSEQGVPPVRLAIRVSPPRP